MASKNSRNPENKKTKITTIKRTIFDFSSVEDLSETSHDNNSDENRSRSEKVSFSDSYITYAPKRHSFSVASRYGIVGNKAATLSRKKGSMENLTEHAQEYGKMSKSSKYSMLSKSTPDLCLGNFQMDENYSLGINVEKENKSKHNRKSILSEHQIHGSSSTNEERRQFYQEQQEHQHIQEQQEQQQQVDLQEQELQEQQKRRQEREDQLYLQEQDLQELQERQFLQKREQQDLKDLQEQQKELQERQKQQDQQDVQELHELQERQDLQEQREQQDLHEQQERQDLQEQREQQDLHEQQEKQERQDLQEQHEQQDLHEQQEKQERQDLQEQHEQLDLHEQQEKQERQDRQELQEQPDLQKREQQGQEQRSIEIDCNSSVFGLPGQTEVVKERTKDVHDSELYAENKTTKQTVRVVTTQRNSLKIESNFSDSVFEQKDAKNEHNVKDAFGICYSNGGGQNDSNSSKDGFASNKKDISMSAFNGTQYDAKDVTGGNHLFNISSISFNVLSDRFPHSEYDSRAYKNSEIEVPATYGYSEKDNIHQTKSVFNVGKSQECSVDDVKRNSSDVKISGIQQSSTTLARSPSRENEPKRNGTPKYKEFAMSSVRLPEEENKSIFDGAECSSAFEHETKQKSASVKISGIQQSSTTLDRTPLKDEGKVEQEHGSISNTTKLGNCYFKSSKEKNKSIFNVSDFSAQSCSQYKDKMTQNPFAVNISGILQSSITLDRGIPKDEIQQGQERKCGTTTPSKNKIESTVRLQQLESHRDQKSTQSDGKELWEENVFDSYEDKMLDNTTGYELRGTYNSLSDNTVGSPARPIKVNEANDDLNKNANRKKIADDSTSSLPTKDKANESSDFDQKTTRRKVAKDSLPTSLPTSVNVNEPSDDLDQTAKNRKVSEDFASSLPTQVMVNETSDNFDQNANSRKVTEDSTSSLSTSVKVNETSDALDKNGNTRKVEEDSVPSLEPSDELHQYVEPHSTQIKVNETSGDLDQNSNNRKVTEDYSSSLLIQDKVNETSNNLDQTADDRRVTEDSFSSLLIQDKVNETSDDLDENVNPRKLTEDSVLSLLTPVKIKEPMSYGLNLNTDSRKITANSEQMEERPKSWLMENMMGMFCMLGIKDSPQGGFYKNEKESCHTELTGAVRHRIDTEVSNGKATEENDSIRENNKSWESVDMKQQCERDRKMKENMEEQFNTCETGATAVLEWKTAESDGLQANDKSLDRDSVNHQKCKATDLPMKDNSEQQFNTCETEVISKTMNEKIVQSLLLYQQSNTFELTNGTEMNPQNNDDEIVGSSAVAEQETSLRLYEDVVNSSVSIEYSVQTNDEPSALDSLKSAKEEIEKPSFQTDSILNGSENKEQTSNNISNKKIPTLKQKDSKTKSELKYGRETLCSSQKDLDESWQTGKNEQIQENPKPNVCSTQLKVSRNQWSEVLIVPTHAKSNDEKHSPTFPEQSTIYVTINSTSVEQTVEKYLQWNIKMNTETNSEEHEKHQGKDSDTILESIPEDSTDITTEFNIEDAALMQDAHREVETKRSREERNNIPTHSPYDNSCFADRSPVKRQRTTDRDYTHINEFDEYLYSTFAALDKQNKRATQTDVLEDFDSSHEKRSTTHFLPVETGDEVTISKQNPIDDEILSCDARGASNDEIQKLLDPKRIEKESAPDATTTNVTIATDREEEVPIGESELRGGKESSCDRRGVNGPEQQPFSFHTVFTMQDMFAPSTLTGDESNQAAPEHEAFIEYQISEEASTHPPIGHFYGSPVKMQIRNLPDYSDGETKDGESTPSENLPETFETQGSSMLSAREYSCFNDTISETTSETPEAQDRNGSPSTETIPPRPFLTKESPATAIFHEPSDPHNFPTSETLDIFAERISGDSKKFPEHLPTTACHEKRATDETAHELSSKQDLDDLQCPLSSLTESPMASCNYSTQTEPFFTQSKHLGSSPEDEIDPKFITMDSVTYPSFTHTAMIGTMQFGTNESKETSPNLDSKLPDNDCHPSEPTYAINVYTTKMEISVKQNHGCTCYVLLQCYDRPETRYTYFELSYDTNEWLVEETSLLHEEDVDTTKGVFVSTGQVECQPMISGEVFVISCRGDRENSVFSENDEGRQPFQSNTFVFLEKRIDVSRKITVSKTNRSPANTPLTQKDNATYSKLEDLSTTGQNGNKYKQNDDVITMTILDDIMTAENDISEFVTRDCSWYLDVEESIGLFRFSEDNLDALAIDDDNTVLGNEGFAFGRHSWAIKAAGFFCAIGICYPEEIVSSWYKGAKWVWTTDGLQYSEPNGIQRSAFGQWRKEDVLEIHLDCDESTISFVNTNTNKEAKLSGFTGKVYPYFNLYKGSSLSIFNTLDAESDSFI